MNMQPPNSRLSPAPCPSSTAPLGQHRRQRNARRWATALATTAMWLGVASQAVAATPAELLAGYTAQAGGPASAERGQRLFTQTQGREWSCSSCHGATPTQAGRHAGTGKTIAPLAPAFNAERFSDAAKSEKWFRRNCQDVLGRECRAGEKADVLSWLMTLKP